MRRIAPIVAILMTIASAALAQAPVGVAPANRPPPLSFVNPPFQDGGVIPDQYTGKAVPQPAPSLPLSWTNVPAGTQSFVLIMHDADGAQNRAMNDNLHWLIFNIPGSATSLPQGIPNVATLPDGSSMPNRARQP